jgi:hypothetical protein
MKLPRRNFLHLAAGAAALPAVSRIAWAQAYPNRPVRVIVWAGCRPAARFVLLNSSNTINAGGYWCCQRHGALRQSPPMGI